MTMMEIMMEEINNDLSMCKTWSEKFHTADTKDDIEYYRGCMLRSRYRAEAKEELTQALGYTVLFSDDHDKCIAIYPTCLVD